MKNKNSPMLLIILDGWGITKSSKGNAITLAKTPTIDGLIKKYPYTQLHAHGKYVGLLSMQDGNSEAGHMNIGAGRVVKQDALKIWKNIMERNFFENNVLIEAIRHVKNNDSKLHVMGMLSNEMSAHSHPDIVLALLYLAKIQSINKIYLHLFTDGRDSPKYEALKLIKTMQHHFTGAETVATIIGRFYAMDRKKKWSRTEMTYDALTLGKGHIAKNCQEAILKSYNKGQSDEFIEPYIVAENSRIENNDSVIFFNLRSDRARQLAKTFTQTEFTQKNPNSFKRKKELKNLRFVAMTDFGPDLDSILTAYPEKNLKNTLPIALSEISQLYIAETEKYAHVTYFLNGGYDRKVNGEDYAIITSPDVDSYDETPGMKTKELSNTVIKNLAKKKYDFTFLNIAASDMIGHTGNLQAGIECCEIIDKEVKKIVDAYLKQNGTVIITADHGNIEEMINLKTGEIDTEHSTNPVPFIVINKKLKNKIKLKKGGALADIAPTILDLLDIKQPKEMTGKSLVKS